ncbi:TIGR02466 family protein [Sphingomicrobium astaxanthinifaciens]|uniref:TIGR02466 family protein n=1 Tax=Sphingomicrobium astaxanthinifaciens TaxID=1227949 RepID=UPI001FCBD804|nr:TIGR02466 family protein [Sphingomicrobium astaxanthinifaciens]MCJ7422053.1 TIGR02466 family protein [Sphingomicrobium astaxanthinifaciens]
MSRTRLLFASPLYEAPLKVDLAALARTVRSLAEDDEAGQRWAEEKDYWGYTSYASLDDLPTRDPAIGDLVPLLEKHARAFAKELGWDHRPTLDHLWVNLMDPGAHHSAHIHPHSVLSGTLYVDIPEGAGAIRFEDPRLPMMMAAPLREEDAPEHLQPFVTLRPRAGTLLLWESFLRHEVLPNHGETERLSISFNFA